MYKKEEQKKALGNTGNKVSRLTYAGRFREEDEFLMKSLRTLKISSIIDVGVSDGRTTLELVKKIHSEKIERTREL